MPDKIKYRSGYKYQLAEDYECKLSLITPEAFEDKFLAIEPASRTTANLLIRDGYAWDGPSGMTVDTKDFMRGSAVHDALYQLLRGKHLDPKMRGVADKILHRMCLEDRMFKARAWYVHYGVSRGGGPSADPKNVKKVHEAP